MCADIAVRIMLGRQEQELDAARIRGIGQGGDQRLVRGAASGVVAIETEHHLVGIAEQLVHMVRSAGRAQRGHGIGKTQLGQRHHIHIAFGHQRKTLLAQRIAGFVQAVQLAPLAEYGRFRRVQVLGLVVPQHASAKTDAFALDVTDGKHDAMAKAVVALVLAMLATLVVPDHQTGFFQQTIGVIGKHTGQMVPAMRRIAQAEAGRNAAGQPALLEVVNGDLGCAQLLAVVIAGFFQHVGERGLLLLAFGGAGALFRAGVVIRHLQAVLLCQILHGFDEAHAVVFHQETDGIPVLAAAEAMVELLGRADGERGRFLPVKRAQAEEVGARLAQLHVAAHHLDHIDAGEQILDEAVRNCHGEILSVGRASRRPDDVPNAAGPIALKVWICANRFGILTWPFTRGCYIQGDSVQ